MRWLLYDQRNTFVTKMNESLQKMSDIGKDVAAIRGGDAQSDISHGLVSHVKVKEFFQKIDNAESSRDSRANGI